MEITEVKVFPIDEEKLRAFVLIAPLLLFIVISFILPIGDMLFRSIDDRIVSIPIAVF